MQLAVQSEVARRDTEVKSLEESLNRTIVRLTTERADLAVRARETSTIAGTASKSF